jgi:multiple sugar transport system permease protein
MNTYSTAAPTVKPVVEFERLRRRRWWRGLLKNSISHLILISVAILFFVPFVWLVVTSLKPVNQVFTDPPIWIPNPILWKNYADALLTPAFPFLRLLNNTLFYVISTTVGTVVSSTMVAYGLARLRFPGKNFLFVVTLATMMMPGIVTLIPTYILFKTIN